jgi:hypothetical protein
MSASLLTNRLVGQRKQATTLSARDKIAQVDVADIASFREVATRRQSHAAVSIDLDEISPEERTE